MTGQNLKRDRPTIGILAGWSSLEGSQAGPRPDHYRGSVIEGIQSAIHSLNCHLLIGWGTRPIPMNEFNRPYTAWPELSPETDFVPVGPWNTDGLIVFTPLAHESQSLYLQELRREGFPVLFIASGEEGPAVSINSSMGIRQAVEHLAEHGHRRIVFLAGLPTDLGDSKIRLDAYYSAVVEYNLEADPELVNWGWHDFIKGRKTMQQLLARGTKFTAVVASNDGSAIGAMQAIREAGLRIPQDVAIIGFDDEPGAIAQVPPLTTMHVALNLIGEQALLLMVDHLTQQAPLESILLSPRLIRRRSCGCIPEVISSVICETSHVEHVSIALDREEPSLQTIQDKLVNEMLSALPSRLRFSNEKIIRQICTSLVDAFYTSLKDKHHLHFESTFIDLIQELEIADAPIDYWQEIISILRRKMMQLPLAWGAAENLALAENMLHQARTVLGESALRQDRRHQYLRDMVRRTLNKVTSQLSIALTDAQMVASLNTYLPEIGIRHARVMYFEAEGTDPVAWSITPGLLEDRSLNKRFRSRDFPPKELYTNDELLNLILLPLVFQNEVLGYAAFDATDIGACAVVARQLTATIKISRLHAQVVELSLTDVLTGLHNRRYLEIFFKNEFSRSQRFNRKLAVIMIDLDHFKQYNDLFGHPEGDEALRQLAECLNKGRRSSDVVVRIGGEEFVIVLQETDIDGTIKVAEQLRTTVTALSNLKRPITISLGVAMLNEHINTAEALLEKADQALYEAKKSGRNRICIYSEKMGNE